MKTIAIFIVLVGIGLTLSGVQAEIYSWTDENGIKHYSHIPPADRSVPLKTATEIQPGPPTDQKKEKIAEENVEAVLEDLDKEDKSSAPGGSTTQQNLSRQDRIQNEKKKLEEKLAYLENLPSDAFANSRSRNVIIGKYSYRLQQLLSDPDNYFDKYGF